VDRLRSERGPDRGRWRHADAVGLAPVEPQIDFARVMDHAWSAIRAIEPHDSPKR
jgi:hypothetical protein